MNYSVKSQDFFHHNSNKIEKSPKATTEKKAILLHLKAFKAVSRPGKASREQINTRATAPVINSCCILTEFSEMRKLFFRPFAPYRNSSFLE